MTEETNGTPVCCLACGRVYDDLTAEEITALETTGKCPSDDCPGVDLYSFAVIGRILGDDEDTCHVFSAKDAPEAAAMFERDMLGGMSQEEIDNLTETYGENPVVVNYILRSNTEIDLVSGQLR